MVTHGDSIKEARGSRAERRGISRGARTQVEERTLAEHPTAREHPSEPPNGSYALDPAPIPAGWILEGAPEAHGKILSWSSDDMALTVMWDCTAGRFNWFYDIDETICVMEGTITVRDAVGVATRLGPGDTFFFPAGSRYEWTVLRYVRKVAFIHVPLSPKLRLARRVYRALTGMLKPRRRVDAVAGTLLKGP